MKNLLRDISAFLLDISEGGRPIEPSAGLCQNIIAFEHAYGYFEQLAAYLAKRISDHYST